MVDTAERVLQYYKKLFKNGLSESEARQMSTLWIHTQGGASYDYLDREPLDRLLLGLHAWGAKFCGRCRIVQVLASFTDDGAICAGCRADLKAARRKKWREANRSHTAKYMRQYRAAPEKS
jgi:hypothetical protein